VLDLWAQHGLKAAIVSGGSTPSAYQSHETPELTEIRPGTYVFNDMNTVRGGYCSLDDCSAHVIATVVSNAVPGQIVVDAGSKTLARDLNSVQPDSGHGHVLELPAAKIDKLSEEHAQIDVSKCAQRPAVGTRLSLVPNHICTCINLQDAIYWIEPNEPPCSLQIDARGTANLVWRSAKRPARDCGTSMATSTSTTTPHSLPTFLATTTSHSSPP
jgi:D-serine deaminase-like pyridoxal phosphate-dependent protein